MELLDFEDTGRPRQPDETTDSIGPAEFQQEVFALLRRKRNDPGPANWYLGPPRIAHGAVLALEWLFDQVLG